MTAIPRPVDRRNPLPPLVNGDHLDQKTFHERYEAMPGVRAQLIGGIVYMSSPMKMPHGDSSGRMTQWLFAYADATPGTKALQGATNILGPESEPEPDGCLLILPDHGGQTWFKDEYLNGAPELVGEVSDTTASIDLNRKKLDYEKSGVREYMVAALRSEEVFWFSRRRGKFKPFAPGSDGIFRSEVFPGLWLDPAALLRGDGKRLLKVLRQGLASPEHAAFVEKLAARK